MSTRATKRQQSEVDTETIAALAAEFVAWRLGGCPGFGFWDAYKAKVGKVAKKAGQSYGELWAIVHAVAEPEIIKALEG